MLVTRAASHVQNDPVPSLVERSCRCRGRLYARQLAPFLTKHIPGKPAVIVKNMPGAGSLKLAGYMQNVAPRDGTELATVSRGAPAEALLAGNRIKFDPVISNWIGSMNN